MIEGGDFAATLARCWRLAKRPLGPSLGILGLGLLAAMFEGLALLLFVPLVQALSGAAGEANFIELQFARLFGSASPSQAVAASVLLLCLLVLAKNVAAFAGLWLTRRTEGEVAHRLRVQIFRQTLDSCIDYRPGVRRSEIVTTLAENSWKVAKVLALACRMAISAATILLFGALLALISPMLLLFSILFLGLGSILIRLATREAAAVGSDVVRENKAFGLHIWERVQALQLIRTFGREADESRAMEDISERVRGRLLRLDLLWGTPGPLTEGGILLLIGGLILIAERLGLGVASLAAFLTLLYRLQAPARELMEGRVAIEGMAGGVVDVDALIEESRAPFLVDGTIEPPRLRDGIRFDRVTFAYQQGSAPVLTDVSLFIPAGRTTAIVGPSGAGKSTLLSLLQRFYDPSSGRVLVDDVPLEAIRLASWRGRLSLMSQDVQLFNESVRANIAYALPGADEEAIIAAARVAHADEFIAHLPEGYDTLIGDRGLRLSGGQRQRLALARTILRGSDILLLDEPTNALDPELEQAFQEALALHSRGKTLVVIAHRLNTIMRADQVIVLEQGRVVEHGAPAELLRSSGRFEELCERQRAMGALG
ncbi:ABC transporter ATP-binding protein [Sphingomonas sp. LHG3406-1]|uniref:ABC transporter ATP-binding protein n=1 Tax=Sphingomonas sp. LHG3406-1 TaxID=2804617 RepID=UPI0026237536|nr:ABC transporter ATP-binding protein [Sphingomonas sp. LHG3406-1]